MSASSDDNTPGGRRNVNVRPGSTSNNTTPTDIASPSSRTSMGAPNDTPPRPLRIRALQTAAQNRLTINRSLNQSNPATDTENSSFISTQGARALAKPRSRIQTPTTTYSRRQKKPTVPVAHEPSTMATTQDPYIIALDNRYLEPDSGDEWNPGPEDDLNEVFGAEEILAERRTGPNVEYLIKWEGVNPKTGRCWKSTWVGTSYYSDLSMSCTWGFVRDAN